MVLIDSCLGVGEVAVSDHRSSVPSVNHLANIGRYDSMMFAALESKAVHVVTMRDTHMYKDHQQT